MKQIIGFEKINKISKPLSKLIKGTKRKSKFTIFEMKGRT